MLNKSSVDYANIPLIVGLNGAILRQVSDTDSYGKNPPSPC